MDQCKLETINVQQTCFRLQTITVKEVRLQLVDEWRGEQFGVTGKSINNLSTQFIIFNLIYIVPYKQLDNRGASALWS